MLDKSLYSFLIAFARQLAQALDSDDDNLAVTLSSLAQSMALLDRDWSVDLGDDPGGDPESVDDVDAPGHDTPLGAALARIEELERSATAAMDLSRRECGRGPVAAGGEGMDMGRKRRKSTLLKGGKRRGA